MTVDDTQRARVRAELPEVEWIEDADLAGQSRRGLGPGPFPEFLLARSLTSAAPAIPTPRRSRTAPRPTTSEASPGSRSSIADELGSLFPGLEYDRDLLIAAALCHDVGKPWEFDPENQARWAAERGRTGWPSIRHPGYGVHICLTVGLPEEVAHVAGGHSGEGELVQRSLINHVVHQADCAFWRVLQAGGQLVED